METDITSLTEHQLKAFKKLEREYKKCIKLNILFVNLYGSLYGYDRKKINAFGDSSSGFNPDLTVTANERGNSFSIANEWADDSHLFELTPLGLKILNQEE